MPQRRKLAAILVADVAGYSRLMAADERETVETLGAHRRRFQDRVSAHHGRIVDAPGDALLAEFPSAVEAVQAAAAVQGDLFLANQALPEPRRMRFRIGLNLGDVLEQDGALYGDGVNVAARLQELADPGGVCISGTAFDQVDGKVPFAFKFMGEQSAKNIPRPIRVYRLVNDRKDQGKKRWKVGQPALLAVGMVLLAVLGYGWISWWQSTGPARTSMDPVLAIPSGPSIAVLAFENMSGDPAQGYFADGISEDITTNLTRFVNLKVLGRNSTFSYKGKGVDIQQVARELGADYVLEGSVRRDDKRIRVTAQLLDGRNGSHIWAQAFDRDLSASALFAAQDDIADKVAAAIADTHGAIALARLQEARRKAPENLASYDCVLLAQEYQRVLSKEIYYNAKACLERALQQDAQYADAWAWLGNLYYDGGLTMGYLAMTAPEVLSKAEEAAQRALKLDPNHQWARANLALLHFYRRDVTSGIAEAERALALNPNNTQTLADLSWRFASAGKWERAVALMEKSIALNPNPPGWYYGLLTMNYYRQGEWEQALPYARRAEVPDFFWSYVYLASINAQLGRMQEAQEALRKLLALKPDLPVTIRDEAEGWFYSNPELIESILEGLRKAGLEVRG
jgi:TolB-like protein/class 3 adenylate cyclase/Tfp pilus assembly protein PilF